MLRQDREIIDEGAELVALRAEAARLHEALETANSLAELRRAQLATVTSALEHWQTCSMCGQRMEAPGHCQQAMDEEKRGLESMHDQTLTRAEQAEAQLQAAQQTLTTLRTALEAAGFNPKAASPLQHNALCSFWEADKPCNCSIVKVKAALAAIPEAPHQHQWEEVLDGLTYDTHPPMFDWRCACGATCRASVEDIKHAAIPEAPQ